MGKTRVAQAIEDGRIRLVRDETVTVDTAATRVLRPNPNRVGALVTNHSANPGRAAPDPGVSTTRGAYVAQNGGSWQLAYAEDGEGCFREWYMMLETASGSVHVMEWEVYDG